MAGKPAVLKVDVRADDTQARGLLSGFSSFTTGITAGIAAGVTSAAIGVVSQAGTMVLDFATDIVAAGLRADDAADHIVRVFEGAALDIVNAWAGVAAETFGVTTSQFQEAATKIGRVMIQMGVDQGTAANLTVEIAQKAADLAETYGLEWSDAFDILSNAALGKMRGIQQFTGIISDEMIADIIAKGETAGQEAGSPAEAMAARLKVVFDKLGGVTGAYKDDLNDLDGGVSNITVQFEQFKEQLGLEVLPALTELLPTIKQLFQIFIDNKDAIVSAFRAGVLVIEAFAYSVSATMVIAGLFSDAWGAAGAFVVNVGDAVARAWAAVGIIMNVVAAALTSAAVAVVNEFTRVRDFVGGIISWVSEQIDWVRDRLGSLPIVGGFLQGIVPGWAGGDAVAASFEPTVRGVSFGTPVQVDRAGPANGSSFTVFGAVTGTQVVDALARFSRQSGPLSLAGVRLT